MANHGNNRTNTMSTVVLSTMMIRVFETNGQSKLGRTLLNTVTFYNNKFGQAIKNEEVISLYHN